MSFTTKMLLPIFAWPDTVKTPLRGRIQMTQERMYNVQILRFIAASAVVFSHSADLILAKDSFIWTVPWTSGVDVFFVISGFIMHWLARDKFGQDGASKDFLIRRLIRVIPSYWIFTLITIFVVGFMGGRVRNTSIDPTYVVTSLLFVPWPRINGQMNPVLAQGWTLNYEMFFYAAFALFINIKKGYRYLICTFTIISIIYYWIPDKYVIIKYLSSPIILEFVAGIILSMIYQSGRRMSAVQSNTCIVAALALFVGLKALIDAIGGVPGPVFLLPAFILCAAFVLRVQPNDISRVGRWLVVGGDASYTIYLSHYLTVNAIILLWGRLGIGLPVVELCVAMAAALITSLCFYFAIERPLTAALQRCLKPRTVGASATGPNGR